MELVILVFIFFCVAAYMIAVYINLAIRKLNSRLSTLENSCCTSNIENINTDILDLRRQIDILRGKTYFIERQIRKKRKK